MSSEDFSSLLPGPGSLIGGGAGCSSLCIGGGEGRVGGGVSGCLVSVLVSVFFIVVNFVLFVIFLLLYLVVAGVIGLLVTGLGSG